MALEKYKRRRVTTTQTLFRFKVNALLQPPAELIQFIRLRESLWPVPSVDYGKQLSLLDVQLASLVIDGSAVSSAWGSPRLKKDLAIAGSSYTSIIWPSVTGADQTGVASANCRALRAQGSKRVALMWILYP